MTVPKRLIVNADDLGRTPGVNRGVMEAHALGIVTSATLLVTAEAAVEGARLARERPQLGVGLHFALSGGLPPALPKVKVPTLVDARGLFHPKPDGLAGADPHEILAEARAQLRRFRELMGGPPTHLDSHHHVHRMPAALQALVTLSWETGLPVRNASPAVKAVLDREGIPTTDHFIEDFHGDKATLQHLVRILGELDPGTTELMCHPAVMDDALRLASGYAEPRARELRALTHPDVRATLQALGIRVSTFAGL